MHWNVGMKSERGQQYNRKHLQIVSSKKEDALGWQVFLGQLFKVLWRLGNLNNTMKKLY
jgi:hypothetical protein